MVYSHSKKNEVYAPYIRRKKCLKNLTIAKICMKFSSKGKTIPLTFLKGFLVFHESSLLFEPLALPHFFVDAPHLAQRSRDFASEDASQMRLNDYRCSSFSYEHNAKFPAAVCVLHLQSRLARSSVICIGKDRISIIIIRQSDNVYNAGGIKMRNENMTLPLRTMYALHIF